MAGKKSSSLDHPPDSQPQIGFRLLVRLTLRFNNRELQESDQRSMKMQDPSRHRGSKRECGWVEQSHGGSNSHNALFVSKSGRKPSSSSCSFFFLDTLKVPQRDVILAWCVGLCIISHHLFYISRTRPFFLIGPSRFFICGCRCTAGTMAAFITGIWCGELIAR